MDEQPPLPPPPAPPLRPPKVKRLPRQTGPRCSPRQRALQHIPLIPFDIKGGVAEYVTFMRARTVRSHRIAPVKYCGVGVTPHRNPSCSKDEEEEGEEEGMAAKEGEENDEDRNKKSGQSYHRIRLKNSDDPSLMVELLVSDYDEYITAFRRAFRRGQNYVWGPWNRLIGEYVPSWLNPVDCRINGTHSKMTTVGGSSCIEHMFYSLARPDRSDHQVQEAILRAVIMFCEALRLLCILRIIIMAMGRNLNATALDDHIWARINSWGILSKFALQVGIYGEVVSPVVLARTMAKCHYHSFSEIIGPQGDLTLLKRKDALLLDEDIKEWLQQEGAGEDIEDPGFE